MFRRIGQINSFNEIPWGKKVMIMGSVCHNDWCYGMPGAFRKNERGYYFENDFGMKTYFKKEDFIGVNLMEAYAHRPEDATEGRKS